MEVITIYTATLIALIAIYLFAVFLCLTDDSSGKRKHLAATILFWPFFPIIKRFYSRALTSREILGFGFLLLLVLLAVIITLMRVSA